MARNQVNITLPPELRDVLEALAFLEESSASEVLRPLVESFLAREGTSPEVAAALEALSQRRKRHAARVTDLKSHSSGPSTKGRKSSGHEAP